MNTRFLIPALPPIADPPTTHAALSDSQNTVQAALNTLDDEANLASFYLHGVGRVDGCVLTFDAPSGRLRLPNGWFLAGCGLDATDASYWPGARLVLVNGSAGYIELVGDNAPPASSVTFGFMSASGDVVWSNAPLVGSDGRRPGGRWMIGQVTTDASGSVTAVDATLADIVGQKPATSGGNGAAPIEFAEDLKALHLDPRPFWDVLNEKLADIEARISKIQDAADLFPHPFAVLASQTAIVTAGLAEINPPSIERGQVSVMVANAGHSQNDTPDYSPDTNDLLELPFNSSTGLFGT